MSEVTEYEDTEDEDEATESQKIGTIIVNTHLEIPTKLGMEIEPSQLEVKKR